MEHDTDTNSKQKARNYHESFKETILPDFSECIQIRPAISALPESGDYRQPEGSP